MKILFALSLLIAGMSYAEEAQEVAQEQKVVVKKLLPEDQEDEVAQEDVLEEQE